MIRKFCMALLGASVAFNASAGEIKNLPKPDKSSVLMKMIEERKSSREYNSKEVELQTLSDILWSAFGVNERGTRTIATSRNKQNLNVYVVYQNSVWKYQAQNNELEKVLDTDKDVMDTLTTQDFVKDAPVTLIYTGSDKINSYFHAGSASQNVYLYATSKGLNTIVRGYIDKEELKNKLRLERDEFVIMNQVIGYPKG